MELQKVAEAQQKKRDDFRDFDAILGDMVVLSIVSEEKRQFT